MTVKGNVHVGAVIASSALVFLVTGFAANPTSSTTVTSGPWTYTVTPAPPRFDPLTASNSKLAQYGFPQRPTNPSQLAKWTVAMRHAKTFVIPNLVPTSDLTSPAAGEKSGGSNAAFSTDVTGSWAGYSVDSPNNGNVSYYGANATWTVPSVASNSSFSWSNGDPLSEVPWLAQWAGMGGAPGSPSNSILQDGVVEVSASTTKYRFFTENYPNSAVLEGPTISSGDVAYVTVSTTNNGNGTYLTSYFVENESTGEYGSFTVDTAASSVSEWSDEFETEVNSAFAVPRFTSIPFSSCEVSDSSGITEAFGDQTYTKQVDESGGYTLMEPSSVNTSKAGFTVTFVNP